MPLNLFKNPNELKYEQDSLKNLANPATGKEASRYQGFIYKQKQKRAESPTNVDSANKVESIFGNKGKYLKQQDFLNRAKKGADGFKFQEIKYPNYSKSQEEARIKVLQEFKEKYCGNRDYLNEQQAKDSLLKMEKDIKATYVQWGALAKQQRKELEEKRNYLEQFFGLSKQNHPPLKESNVNQPKPQGFLSWLISGK